MLELRPYQSASVESLRAGFRENHTRQVLAAPTGSGKSRIMEYMIDASLAKGSRIMFICERRILVEQFSRHLENAGIEHGVLMAKHWRFRPHLKVQVASAQTLERMESIPIVDIVFIDELHACLRKSVIGLIQSQPNLRMVGATATPFHPAIGTHFSNVVSVTTMAQLVEDKFLVPARVFVAKEIDTKGLKIVAGEWKKDDLETRGKKIVGDIVSDYIRISNEVFKGYRKTICFSCGIAHGAELVEKFMEAGVNAVQISANDDDDYRDEILRDFAKPDSDIKVVISVAILSRGFDQSDIDHVILARPLKKSFSEHVQMIGRGARIHEGKEFFVVQDNSGNFLRFRDDWDKLYNDGVTSLAEGVDVKPKKEPSDEQKEAAKCPQCGALWSWGSDTCINCGMVRVRRNDVVAVAGEMTELGARAPKAEKYSSEYKRVFYCGLIGELQRRGKNIDRAYYLYQETFGSKPVWQKQAGPAGPEVMNWITRSNMKYAKGKNR